DPRGGPPHRRSRSMRVRSSVTRIRLRPERVRSRSNGLIFDSAFMVLGSASHPIAIGARSIVLEAHALEALASAAPFFGRTCAKDAEPAVTPHAQSELQPPSTVGSARSTATHWRRDCAFRTKICSNLEQQ